MLDEEEKHLQKGSDGAVHMFYNGIFNSPDEAAGNAVQMAVNKNGHLYFTYHPQAKDWEVELGIAIYEYFGGWSNSSKKFQGFITRYGNDEAIVSAHSRGSLTVGNGLRDFEKRGIHGLAEKTDIYLVGPAYNAQDMAGTIYVVSDGKKDHVYLQNHVLDPIGMYVGHNPPTAYQYPLKPIPLFLMTSSTSQMLSYKVVSSMIEMGKALGGYDPSPHNCYADASNACKWSYGSFTYKPIYPPDLGKRK